MKLSIEKYRELCLGGNKHWLGDGCLSNRTAGEDLQVLSVDKLNISQYEGQQQNHRP